MKWQRNNLGQFTIGASPRRIARVHLICPVDKKEFEVKRDRIKHAKIVCCSRACANVVRHTGKERKKWGRSRWFWAEKPSEYRNLHKKIYKAYGKPDKCEECKQNKSRYYWANISGEYKLIRTDWIMLCAKCHWHYDKNK